MGYEKSSVADTAASSGGNAADTPFGGLVPEHSTPGVCQDEQILITLRDSEVFHRHSSGP